jgi:hypothetical protein
MTCGCTRIGLLRYLNPPTYDSGGTGFNDRHGGGARPLQLSGFGLLDAPAGGAAAAAAATLAHRTGQPMPTAPLAATATPTIAAPSATPVAAQVIASPIAAAPATPAVSVSMWPPVAAYILYLDTLHYTEGEDGQPYQVQEVPVSIYGPPAAMAVPISNPPPDAVGSAGGVNVIWIGTLNAVGQGTTNGMPVGTNPGGAKAPSFPGVTGQIAQTLAQHAGGAPVAIGMLSQTTSIGAFLQQMQALQAAAAAPITAAPVAAQVVATPVTSAPTSASGASSSNVAPMILPQAASAPSTPTAPIAPSVNQYPSQTIAPAMVNPQPVSELPIAETVPSTPTTITVNAQSELPWILLIGLGALVFAMAA